MQWDTGNSPKGRRHGAVCQHVNSVLMSCLAREIHSLVSLSLCVCTCVCYDSRYLQLHDIYYCPLHCQDFKGIKMGSGAWCENNLSSLKPFQTLPMKNTKHAKTPFSPTRIRKCSLRPLLTPRTIVPGGEELSVAFAPQGAMGLSK